MTLSTVSHDTFVIERTYDAPVAQIFRAWADPKLKARWFAGSVDALGAGYELDFRVGGREINRGGPPGGPIYTYESQFHDIVPEHRIVYAYDMYADETRILCPWQRSSSAARTPQRIWSSPSRGHSSMATTPWRRENREHGPFWTRWLPS